MAIGNKNRKFGEGKFGCVFPEICLRKVYWCLRKVHFPILPAPPSSLHTAASRYSEGRPVFRWSAKVRDSTKSTLTIVTIVSWHGAPVASGPPVWMHFDIGAGVLPYSPVVNLRNMFC